MAEISLVSEATAAAAAPLPASAVGSSESVESTGARGSRAAGAARRWQRLAGLVLVLCAAVLYALTLDNGLQPGELIGGDLITHQYAQVQARPSNAPGYPLYTMGGWTWFHGIRLASGWFGQPLPNPLPILSSYSTLWALVALWLLYEILCRLTRGERQPAGNWLLAWLVAAFYAVTYFFWYYATTTEQYTSAIAQTLAIFYVYLLWQEAAGESRTVGAMPNKAAPRSSILLVALAFLCGLALAHMLTVAFIVPPLVVAILWQQPQVLRQGKLMALCAAAALLPLTSYFYVYARGAAHPEWWGAGDWPTAQAWFWSFVSTAQGRDELAWGFEPGRAFFGNGFPELIWRELSLLFVLVGAAGIALLPRRTALVLYGTLAIYLVFDWMYRYGNWFQVILPAYPLLLLGVMAAFDRWEAALAPQRWLRYAPHALVVMAIAWRGASSWPGADSRDRAGDTALARAAVLLDQPLPAGAGLFAAVDDALALDYLLEIWGLRRDLAPRPQVVSSDRAGDVLRRGLPVLATAEAAPTLLAELPEELQPAVAVLSPDWLLVTGQPLPAPTPAVAVEQPVEAGVALAGYTLRPGPGGAPVTEYPPALDVTLFWRLEKGRWPDGLAISLRPLRQGAPLPDPTNPDAIIQADASAPAHGLREALVGARGLVADSYRLPWPAGADGLSLLLYRQGAEGFTNVAEIPLPVPATTFLPQ